MALVGYEQVGPSAYRFKRDDGAAQTFFGPEAERMKAWVDQTKQPDMRTAQVDPRSIMAGSEALNPNASMPAETRPSPPPVASDAGGMSMAPQVSAAPPPAPLASMPPPGPPPPAPPSPVAAGLPPALQKPHQVVQAPRPAAAPSPAGGMIGEPPSDTSGLPPMAVGGGAAQAPQGAGALEAVREINSMPRPGGGGGKAKLALTERSVEGPQRTPEELAADAKALAAQRAVNDASIAQIGAVAKQKEAAYSDEYAQAQAAAKAAQDRIQQAQLEANHVEDRWNSTLAGLQREQDAVANQKVDPKRLFSGADGTLNAVMSTIGVALGTFGSSLTGGPNYALQLVNSAIQRDIDAQVDQIHRKGENANNAVANFMRAHGLDVQEAKTAVKAIGQQYAGSVAQMQAAKMGSLDAKQKAAEMQAQLANEAAKTAATIEPAFKAKVAEKYKMQGGGAAQPKFKWVVGDDGKARLFNLENGKIEQTADAGDVANTPTAKPGGGGPGKLSARLGAVESVNEAAQKDLSEMEKSDPGGWIGLPGPAKKVYRTDAQIDLEAKARAFASKFIAANGEPLTEAAQEQMVEQLTDRNPRVREEARKAIGSGARTYHQAIERQRGGTEQGVGPEQEGQ